MPVFTFVRYDGSDDRILELVSQLIPKGGSSAPDTVAGNRTSGTWNEIARRFEQYVSATAAAGNPSQRNAMLAWLRAGGEIGLVKLWKAAGVRVQHDYSGVGGSLTKNMVKARGPKDWYNSYVNDKGEWIYKILPELTAPLKHSFGVK